MTLQSDFQVGLAVESTYGTAVPVSRFYEADASLGQKITRVQGRGYRPGRRVARGDRSVPVKYEVSGDLDLDAADRGLGLLLKAFFGTSTITQDGETGVYQQVHTLQQSDFLDSYTIQQGIPRLGSDVVDAFTFPGCQCTELDVTAKASEVVDLKASWMGRGDVDTDTALATASYPASVELLTFVGASLGVGGTLTAATSTTKASMASPVEAKVTDFSLTLKNALDSDGYYFGGAGKRGRPGAAQGLADDAIAGSITVEYTVRDLADAYMEQGGLALLVEFSGTADIATGQKAVLQFAIPMIKLDGDLPTSNKAEVITVQHAFKGYDPAAGEPIQAVYRSLDTTI